MPNSKICETMFRFVMCHLVGDYILQSDFIAKTKGESWYHLLLVHCLLYCLPFYLAFGFTWQLFVLFGVHVVVDVAKTRYEKIGYAADQAIHYAVLMIYFV